MLYHIVIRIQRKRKIFEVTCAITELAYFVSVYSARAHIYPQNASRKKNDLSKSKNFTLQRRNVQLLPLNSNVINQSSKMTPSSMENDVYATNAKYNPCWKFTETIYKCKSFLKELQRNDKYLRSLNRPSKMSKVSSLKTAHTAGQVSLSITVLKLINNIV